MSQRYDVKQALQSLLRVQQTNRMLRLTFPRKDGPDDALMVPNEFVATEEMSRDFEFKVTILSDRADLVSRNLVGKLVTISLVRDDGNLRHFNGHIFSLRFVKNDAGFCHYAMILGPWLAFLRHSRNSYHFNGMSVESQTDLILSRYRMSAWRTVDLGPDEPMTDAFQYNESDYNYLHRRFEAKGWHYRYIHDADGHTLVLSGDSIRCKAIDGDGELIWQGSISGLKQCGVQTFSPSQIVSASLYSATSFDFKKNRVNDAQCSTLFRQDDVPPIEVHEHLSAYGIKTRVDGDDLTRLRMEELEALTKRFEASGNDARVEAGRTFKLREHRDPLAQLATDDEDEFLILSTTHEASNNYQAKVQPTGPSDARYGNTFTCIEKRIPWRPGREFNSTDTRIHGVLTAIVVGPPGEEIHTDEFGRARVQFHWDRAGQSDMRSSSLIRVASGSAGDGFGLIFIPRGGQEVAVQFIDSNPDRPLITGSLYNAVHLPPRFNHGGKLPDQQNLSGIKSKEVNGGGYNQLRLDDTPGQVSTQLASSHGHTQLNMGSLVHPRYLSENNARGEGFELATDHSGAIRSAKGLLLTAFERLNACAEQLSCDEHLALMQACLDTFKTLGKYAAENQGAALDDGPQADLANQIKAFASGASSPIAITSPDGLSFATNKSIVSYSAVNTDVVAHHHLQHVAGKKLALNAGDGISLFSRQNGIRQIAHYGKFILQSQHDDVAINAAKNLTLTADGVLKIMANEIHLIAKDGSFTKWGGGGITLGTNGNVDCKSSMLVTQPPATMHTEMPHFDGEGKAAPRWIALHYVDPETTEGMAGVPYEIHFDGAPTLTGTLDDSGKARHDNVSDKPVTQVVYKPRPAGNDDDAAPLHSVIA